MDRRSWWLGVALLAAVIALHALIPRYDVRVQDGGIIRVDRWTGHVELGQARNLSWVTLAGPHIARFEDIQSVAPPPK